MYNQACVLVKEKTKEMYDLEIGPWMAIFVNRDGMEMGTGFNIIKAFGSGDAFYTLLLRYLAPGYNPTVELQLFRDITYDIFKWCGSDVVQFYNKDTFEGINFLDNNWKEIKSTGSDAVLGIGQVFKMSYDGENIEMVEVPSSPNIKKRIRDKRIVINYKTTGSILKLEEDYHNTRKPELPPKGWWARQWEKFNERHNW